MQRDCSNRTHERTVEIATTIARATAPTFRVTFDAHHAEIREKRRGESPANDDPASPVSRFAIARLTGTTCRSRPHQHMRDTEGNRMATDACNWASFERESARIRRSPKPPPRCDRFAIALLAGTSAGTPGASPFRKRPCVTPLPRRFFSVWGVSRLETP